MDNLSTKQSRLTAEQTEEYRRQGYLILPDPVFPDHTFQGLKTHFERKLAELPPEVRPEAMDCPHFTDPALFAWLFSDAVLGLVEPILGPNIALFASHFICKPKGNGKRVPWHEDSFYWKRMLEPMEVVTVWLAIDPSTRANGCMRVIPRTHDNGYSEYEPVDPEKNVFAQEIKKLQFDASGAVPIELSPNHCSLHDGRLIHGSDPNNSDQRRCGYTMRYVSTATKLTADAAAHHLYLAKGHDIAGNHYGDPEKSYPELARYRQTHVKNFH